MKIDNIVTRYLMQYELLLNLVAPNHLQKEITTYIREIYNPAIKTAKVGFKKARKPGKNYDEDDITFHRNLLGHNSTIQEVSDKEIEIFSNKLADILLFTLLS